MNQGSAVLKLTTSKLSYIVKLQSDYTLENNCMFDCFYRDQCCLEKGQESNQMRAVNANGTQAVILI